MEEYIQEVSERYLNLPEESKDILRSVKGTPVGEVLAEVLGPEVGGLMGQLRDPMPMEEPPVEEPMPMARGGLVNRRKKSVAKKK